MTRRRIIVWHAYSWQLQCHTAHSHNSYVSVVSPPPLPSKLEISNAPSTAWRQNWVRLYITIFIANSIENLRNWVQFISTKQPNNLQSIAGKRNENVSPVFRVNKSGNFHSVFFWKINQFAPLMRLFICVLIRPHSQVRVFLYQCNLSLRNDSFVFLFLQGSNYMNWFIRICVKAL